MKDIISKNHKEDDYFVASSAISSEEIYMGRGSPIYPPAKEVLRKNGVPFHEHYATILKESDYDKYDLIIAMDSYNIRGIMYKVGDDKQSKVHKLLEYDWSFQDVSDPWYTRDFNKAFNDIQRGCIHLFNYLEGN